MAAHVEDVPSLLSGPSVVTVGEAPEELQDVNHTAQPLASMSLKTEMAAPDMSTKDGLLDFSISYAPGVKPEESRVEDAAVIENPAIPPKLDQPSGELEKEKSKKKKKKKVGGKPPPVTGFEEYFAEAPITADEAAKEKEELYAPEKDFVQRIETAIQRYRARRKFDPYRSLIFTRYLVLGGVEAGPKAFSGGIDTDGNADDIARQAATDYIGFDRVKFYDPTKPEHWVIDFEGIVRGFLSRGVHEFVDNEKQLAIDTCCNVVRNFLNYLLFHGVCPEYTQEIMSARIICDLAEKELWAIRNLSIALPDSFNMACSTLYGGDYQDKYLPVGHPWRPSDDIIEELGQKVIGMEDEEAQCIFQTAMSIVNNKHSQANSADPLHVVKEERLVLEIVEVIRADQKVKDAYSHAKDYKGKEGSMKPLGKVRCKRTDHPVPTNEDCSDDGSQAGDGMHEPIDSDAVEEFWIEDHFLEHCIVGLKMLVTVWQLANGLKYFDKVIGMFCSFYTVLPQERMQGWKDPILSSRGPPTVNNPTGSLVQGYNDDEQDGPQDTL